jgi:hypothetical protein
LVAFIPHASYLKLNPQSQDYDCPKWEKIFGKPIQDITPKGEAADAHWAKFKDGLGDVDACYAKNGREGPFL